MWQALKQRLFRSTWWQRYGKNRREADYWRLNADKMVQWYLHREPFRLPFPNESIRVRGSALSRWFDTLAAQQAPRWSGAIAGLESLAADAWYEGDVIRVHGEVRVE